MTLRNPEALLLFLLLPAFVVAWRARRATRSAALVMRLLIIALTILALADPVVGGLYSPQDSLVLLVDQSASLGAEGQARLREQAAELAGEHPGNVHVILFGANAIPVEVSDAGTIAPLQTVRADHSDLAGALRLARGVIGAGRGRVLLLSDGAATRGDALAEARALAESGVPVDTVAYPAGTRPEFWVAGVEVPETLREGEEYEITIRVHSTTAASAQLSLLENAQLVAEQKVELRPGENLFELQSRAASPGVLALQATIAGQPDTFVQNNSAAATALVGTPPRILLVEGQGGEARMLRAALRPAGIAAEVIDAQLLLPQLSALAAYDGIVLVNVPAGAFSLDQMAALREFVRSEGRGLVATGGPASFTLGSYKDTPLEEVLPVLMTPPPRPERPPVTLLLILDQSASMYGPPGRSKLDMAKEAALLATDTLDEEDRLGVLTFDTSVRWPVEFQLLGSGLSLVQIQEQIGRIQQGGGTNIYNALETGLRELAVQPGEVRHAVLLTDGKSSISDPARYRMLLDEARSRNITLSTIAIGDDSDTELLQELAQLGTGRYHFAAEPRDIPRLTLQESEIARSEPQVEGDFHAGLANRHPVLRGFAANELPGLRGYVATTLKPDAELVLQSPEEDPVLAVWQYGLGRAVAWTPGVNAPWAEDWAEWSDYGRFWAQVIRYTLPEPGSGPLQVRVAPRNDAVTITAESVAPSGEPLDLADTEAVITLPDGGSSPVRLSQVAPGRYAQEVTLPAPGPYAVEVRQHKDGEVRTARTGYVQPYSPEYQPASNGADVLRQISLTTGGTVLASADGIRGVVSAADGSGARVNLWPWLLLAAALLWPLEIAVRRGWLGG